MYKVHYSRFLKANSSKLHFACHSHHYWPDVTREAHLEYWDDCCRYVDNKWEYFYSHVLPEVQSLIQNTLELSHTDTLVFAPNTHELSFRLLSSLNWEKSNIKILTTDSEFYSFDRQINRLSESSQWSVKKVPLEPFATFHERFIEAAQKENYDLIFLSQVFFNSGYVTRLDKIIPHIPAQSLIAIDGYHGFMALPTSFKNFEDRAFYLAGSYKYAQGGEGACFMHVPKSIRHRPLYTGWFAEISHLSSTEGGTPYPENAQQYAGSTVDFSGLYRLRASLKLFDSLGLTPHKIHEFVKQNQRYLIDRLPENGILGKKNLLWNEAQEHGHFLTFELSSTQETQKTVLSLETKGIQVDSRKNRIRIGFGLYHDSSDLEHLIMAIKSLNK